MGRGFLRGARPSKYGAVATVHDGERYDSKAEAKRAMDLTLMKLAGKILRWERGERQLILDGGVGKRVWYMPDFIVYGLDHQNWAEDVKAQDRKTGKAIVTQSFRTKAILWGMRYPHLPLKVVNQHGEVIWRLK